MTETKKCESCKYCTNKVIAADYQIGICIEEHNQRNIEGKPQRQVRLWQNACRRYTPEPAKTPTDTYCKCEINTVKQLSNNVKQVQKRGRRAKQT